MNRIDFRGVILWGPVVAGVSRWHFMPDIFWGPSDAANDAEASW